MGLSAPGGADAAQVRAIVGQSVVLVPPVLADLAWVNQGSASVVQTASGLYLSKTVATDGAHILKQAAPGANFTVEMGFLLTGNLNTFYLLGPVMVSSVSDRFVWLSHTVITGGSIHLETKKYTNPSTYSANYQSIDEMSTWAASAIKWLKVVADATNYTFYTSGNGYNWLQVDQRTRADWISADQVGFALEADAAGGMEVVHWKLTAN